VAILLAQFGEDTVNGGSFFGNGQESRLCAQDGVAAKFVSLHLSWHSHRSYHW
jgi:hypothetical protein